MSGVGKWIKKHPLQTVGLLAGGAFGIPALAGLLSPAAAGGVAGANVGAAALLPKEIAALGGSEALMSAAPMAKLAYDVPQYAALNAGAFNPTTLGPLDKMAAFADKMGPYAKTASLAQGLLGEQQPPMPQIAPPQLRGPGQALSPAPQYGTPSLDPEEERRRMMLAMLMGQQQGVV